MPIVSNLPPTHSFGPEELARMKLSFDAVWTTYGNLAATQGNHLRDEIASAIIRAASLGDNSLEQLIEAGKRAVARGRCADAFTPYAATDHEDRFRGPATFSNVSRQSSAIALVRLRALHGRTGLAADVLH